MTGDAVAGQRRMVHESNRRPVRRDVTIGTFAYRLDVVRRLRRGPNKTARRVATGAGGIGGRKRAAGVTAFACEVYVRAVEREPGAEVIEVL